MKYKLTDLCGNRLLQNDIVNTFCEIRTQARPREEARACSSGHLEGSLNLMVEYEDFVAPQIQGDHVPSPDIRQGT